MDKSTRKTSFKHWLSPINETESLRVLNDAIFSDDLQQAIGLDSSIFSQLGSRLNQVPTPFFPSLF